MTKLENTIINDISESYEEPKTSNLCNKATYSTLFLTPALSLSLTDRYLARYFINAFLDDAGIEHDFCHPIFLLFQTLTFDDNWKLFEKHLRNKENFVHEYVCGTRGDKTLVMFVFECPSVFREDYVRFLNGEYSKFSEFYRKFIQKIIPLGGDQLENPAFGAVNKTDILRKKIEDIVGQRINKEKEYWPIYQPEREIYRYNSNS